MKNGVFQVPIHHTRFQKKGHGQIIVPLVKSETCKAGYSAIKLGIHLKNRPALRFWSRLSGFGAELVLKKTQKIVAIMFSSQSIYQ